MLYLASASPRRREILQMAGERFEVVPSHGDESRPPELSPGELVQELARRKAFAAEVSPGPGDIVLGADTLVALDGRLLGKPSSEGEAFSMLSALSGRVHRVYTGCCLRTAGRSETFGRGNPSIYRNGRAYGQGRCLWHPGPGLRAG